MKTLLRLLDLNHPTGTSRATEQARATLYFSAVLGVDGVVRLQPSRRWRAHSSEFQNGPSVGLSMTLV
jgi:hypothetical protein